MKSRYNFFSCFSFFFFLWTGTTLAFFHSMGSFPLSMHDLNISSKGFTIYSPQIFNIRILIISWLCTSFGSRFFMIFKMPSLVKEIVERLLFVLLRESVGILLVLSTIVPCLVKKLWEISAFSLKSVMELLLW